MTKNQCRRYFFDLLFLAFFFAAFFGTFAPAALASERPIAIACLRLLTFLPDRPLFKVPALRFFIARPTLADAVFEYFRAMTISPGCGKIIFAGRDGSVRKRPGKCAPSPQGQSERISVSPGRQSIAE
jgi:hypothetical protein